MGNILFQNQNQSSNNSFLEMFSQMKAKGPSNFVFDQMYNSNPEFKRFADSVRNMSPEQAFSQYGLDFNQFRDQRW